MTTTNILKSQIVSSINNLNLSGTIDEGLQKNINPLFGGNNIGAIKIETVGLYQIIDSIIKQILDIKNLDKITRITGKDIRNFYTTSLNRYSLRNREKQLYNILKNAPKKNNNTILNLQNDINNTTSEDLKCEIIYDRFFSISSPSVDNDFISLQTPVIYKLDGTRISGEKKFVLKESLTVPSFQNDIKFYYNPGTNLIEFLKDTNANTNTAKNINTADNLKDSINGIIIEYNDNFYTSNGVELNERFVTTPGVIMLIFDGSEEIRFTMSGNEVINTPNSKNRVFQRETDLETTIGNLITVINTYENSSFPGFNPFKAEKDATNKNIIIKVTRKILSNNNSTNFTGLTINNLTNFVATHQSLVNKITIIQPNTDGVIIDNNTFSTAIKEPISNFSSFRHTQFISNTMSKTIQIRGATTNTVSRLSFLSVGHDVNGNIVKKYSEDALFEFFGRMNNEFIKLNNNHIGFEQIYPGSFKNGETDIQNHHLNSVVDFTIQDKEIKKEEFIKQLKNLKRNGNFNSIDINENTETGKKETIINYTENLITIDPAISSPQITIFNVTVVSVNNVNKYYINGLETPTLHLTNGTYRFDQSDPSNTNDDNGHPLRIYTSDNNNGTEYTTTVNGTLGDQNAYTEIVITSATTTPLYYQCSQHSGMGGRLNITDSINYGNITLYDNVLNNNIPVSFSMINTDPSINNDIITRQFKLDTVNSQNTVNLQNTISNLVSSINSYRNSNETQSFTAENDANKRRIIITQETTSNVTNNNVINLNGITITNFQNIFTKITKSLTEQYKYLGTDLFSSSSNQRIPFKNDDSNSIGLYQLINDLVFQLKVLKKKIKTREKYYIELLKNNKNFEENIEIVLDDNYVANLQALNSNCRQQGNLLPTAKRPSFIEIINNTDYNPGISYKYSQDALYELCGRWLNELLKLNNGHSGFENIYPGFFDTQNTDINDHHLNSVTPF